MPLASTVKCGTSHRSSRQKPLKDIPLTPVPNLFRLPLMNRSILYVQILIARCLYFLYLIPFLFLPSILIRIP